MIVSCAVALAAMTALAHADDIDSGACGAINANDAYDQAMHIAAIFIIFAMSILGSMLPVVSNYVSCLRNSRKALSLLNSFGFGVVVATAFIHMIPPAIDTLNNKCLNLSYKGLAMVFVVGTVLAMQLLETELVLFMTRSTHSLDAATDEEAAIGAAPELDYNGAMTPTAQPNHGHHGHHHHNHGTATDDLKSNAMRKTINVLIFEVGVAIHSVIIGLNLGVATGTTFNTLLVALSFHQFFEGVAVGTSSVSAFSSVRTSIYTAIGFSLTTPIGIAIG
ncbi:hypothetical protein As57867_008916, partial [Aphanomyces stellatus]